MAPFVLPNIMIIAESANMTDFEVLILPELVPLMAVQDPIQVRIVFILSAFMGVMQCQCMTHMRSQILQIFLHNMKMLLTKSPSEHVRLCIFLFLSFSLLVSSLSLCLYLPFSFMVAFTSCCVD